MSDRSDPILLVEDDLASLSGLAAILTGEGFAVYTAADGQEALDMFERGVKPGLMVVDLMLPKVSGWALLDYVRHDPDLRFMPTVVVTAVPQHELNLVADAILQKPIDIPGLIGTLRRLI